MKRLVAIAGAAMVVTLSGCSTTLINWAERGDSIEGVYSRQVAFLPHTTQGVDVAPTKNWYYGSTPGIKAYAAEGGIVYVNDTGNWEAGTEDSKENQFVKNASKKPETLSGSANDGEPSNELADSKKELQNDSNNAWIGEYKPTKYFDDHMIVGELALSVNFPLNKSDVMYETSTIELAEFVKRFNSKEQRLVLIGYTDDIGLDDYNIPFSLKRAEYIKKLITNSHPGAEITTIGSGPSPRMVDNRIEDGRKTNRRVEIHLIKKGLADE